MSIHQTPDGRWFVSYWQAGKQVREYMGRGPIAQRLAKARDLEVKRDKVLERRNRPREGITLGAVLDLFLSKSA